MAQRPAGPAAATASRPATAACTWQGRYELQILATPGDKPASTPEPREAGSLYKFRGPDVNASYGPGEWQAYDIWFRAARFDGEGHKTEDARVTVYWNGQLIHDDVRLPGPTGSAAKHGEPIEAGQTVLLLRLVGHLSDANGPVRGSNVWVAPLEPIDYAAGPAMDLFDGETLEGYGPRRQEPSTPSKTARSSARRSPTAAATPSWSAKTSTATSS